MNRFFLSAGAATAVLLGSTSLVSAQGTALFELNAGGLRFSQTDDDESSTRPALEGAAAFSFAISPQTRATFELQSLYVFIPGDEDWDSYTPTTQTVIGGRVEHDLGMGTVGAFVGVGSTNAYDSGVGHVYGLSAMGSFGGADVFAQIGHADIRVDGTDSGFTGHFGQLGTVVDVTASMALMASAGYGYASRGFEDNGDWGDYRTIGLKGVYEVVPGRGFATFGLEHTRYRANTEDSARENRITVGYVLPIGGQVTKRQALRPLSIPLTPFRAAAYGEVLD